MEYSISEIKNGSIIADRFLVLDQKRGGMGHIFFCQDINNDRKEVYALKTLRDEFLVDENARSRFENEASFWLSLGDISDNYVLSLLAILKHHGLPFLKMNFCSQGSLADKLKKGRLSYTDFIRYSTQILIGMELIDCTFNLVHRDLKPANILINENNDVKISDLGLVKSIQGDSCSKHVVLQNTGLSQFNGFLGTIPYAAPEQLLNSSDIDQRADIWAFGLILYEMLTNRNPFSAIDTESLVYNILNIDAPVIKSIAPLHNDLLSSIIMKCLKKNKENRYSTFREVISDWKFRGHLT
jgi:serine/threonine protein kinase